MLTTDAALARIRKLLAVAEHPATPAAEAERAAEAAERLIIKHAIDEALIDAASQTRRLPETRTITIDPPYVSAKVVLLANVAGAHDVRIVSHRGTDRATMVGFASDLDLVDLLFTSLLLQSATAVLRQLDTGRAFRRAFLIGFASEVGRRLADARAEVVAETGGTSTELALRSRREEVTAAMNEAFPRLGTTRTTVSSGQGLAAGHRCGAEANLGARTGALAGRRTAISG